MKHSYEKIQAFNFITRILHSTRYRNLRNLVNEITVNHKKLKVVDIGCGPAKAYEVIKNLGQDFDYFGIELREDFADIAHSRYGENENFEIVCDSVENCYHAFDNADLIIGLESFEHIPENLVVRVVEAIAQSNFKYLYVSVPNEIGPAIFIKNVGSFLMGYRRYREYRWSETIAATLYNLDKVERHGVRHKGFDWRWLAQTLRQNCRIIEITTSPLKRIPKFVSPSIGFICRNDNYRV